MVEIERWLEAQGLGRYAPAFVEQDVSVDLLPDLTDADLRELGISSLGDRKRLLRAIAGGSTALAAAASAPMASAVSPKPAAAPTDASSHRAPVERPANKAAGNEEGERRHATVMFSDLSGYTALNEAFDPEEVEQLMARIKREAIAVIERHGGRVNQFVGDEVMALFGVPIAHRDDPRRAVAAALELHQAVEGVAAGLSGRLGQPLSMHSGIQTGLVIARRSDSRSGDFTVTGDTVNTAARLRSLAQAGELVVSPQTWQQVSDYYEGRAGQAVEVKGKERPLVPWTVLKERTVPKAGSRPLVGRDEEMQQFAALVQNCLQRQRGRVIFVRGDPGMGKTRLVAEFLHLAREQGLNCHSSSMLDFGARTGHDAIRRLAQSLLGQATDADEASRAEAITEFARRSAAAASLAPFLYDILDVAPPSEVRSLLSAIDSTVRQKSTQDALILLASGDESQPPMLLLIEDLHWADPATLKQLSALAALAAKRSILVMMTTRFAGDPSIGEWRTSLHGLPVTSIDLGPLAAEDALRLAAGAASISDALLRGCVERAEGNPLFLEQLLLNAGDESAGALPGSIQALIQARMDRLAPADKAALQAAAVWGQRVSLQAIRHLLADPDFDSQRLEEQFLLRPDGDELVFNHALIRDGAYGSLLLTRRRELHLAAAEWIESQDVALAARHYELAEDGRAAGAYLEASQAQASEFNYPEALGLVERGLKHSAGTAHEFALMLARAKLLLEIGRAAESIDAGRVAVDAAKDGAGKAMGLIAMASGMRILDRAADGLAMLEQAQPLAEQASLTLELSHLHHLRGNLLFGQSRTEECLREHQLALELARKAGSVEAEAAALGGLGDAHYAQCRVRRGREFFERCLALAREHGILRVEVAYGTMKAWSDLYLLDIRGSEQASAHVIALAQRIAHRRGEMMAHAQRAMVVGWTLGRLEEAGAHLDAGLVIARSLGSQRFEGMNHMFRALLAIRRDDRVEARRLVNLAFEVVGPSGTGFIGQLGCGVLARAESDPAARRAALARGEDYLKSSNLSHNYLMFYESAIQVCLDDGQWDEVDRYCGLGDALFAQESFAWWEFIAARGRALGRHGRGEHNTQLTASLESLRQQAAESEALVYLPALDAALEHIKAAAS